MAWRVSNLTGTFSFVRLSQHVLFCSKLLQYIQQKICSHEVQVVAMAKQLHNSIAQEVDKFASLPLDQLHYSGVDRSVIWLKNIFESLCVTGRCLIPTPLSFSVLAGNPLHPGMGNLPCRKDGGARRYKQKTLFCGRGSYPWEVLILKQHINRHWLFQLNTLTFTAKASAVDLYRQNTLRGTKSSLLTTKRYKEHPRPFYILALTPGVGTPYILGEKELHVAKFWVIFPIEKKCYFDMDEANLKISSDDGGPKDLIKTGFIFYPRILQLSRLLKCPDRSETVRRDQT